MSAVAVCLVVVASGCTVQPGERPGSTGPSVAGSTSASPSAPPKPAGWDLDATNVGLASEGLSCASLPIYTGPVNVPSGTVIREKRITVPLNVSQGDVVIERSCVQLEEAVRGMPAVATTNYDTLKPAAGAVVIRDSELDGSLLASELAATVTGVVGVADLVNNYIHHFGSGIMLMDTGDRMDVLVERNYVTGLVAWGDAATVGNHSDAFTVRDFDASLNPERRLVVQGNRFDCNSGNDTGALFIQTYAGRIDNVVIERNLLEGAGYQLALNEVNAPYGDLQAVDNRFSGTGYGPAYVQGGQGWSLWKDNSLFEPAAPDARGESVPKP